MEQTDGSNMGGMEVEYIKDVLAGSISLTPRQQIVTLFPKMANYLGDKIEVLALGCDRFPQLSDVDRILERGGVNMRQCGFKEIGGLADAKVVGDTIFLGGVAYLINGFDSQRTTIGVSVGEFLKAADNRYSSQQRAWQAKGGEICHYLAVGKCRKGTYIVLTTLLRKKPAN